MITLGFDCGGRRVVIEESEGILEGILEYTQTHLAFFLVKRPSNGGVYWDGYFQELPANWIAV